MIHPLLSLDFANDRYTCGSQVYASAANIAEVTNTGPGGIALDPSGKLRLVPAGQPRRASGVGLRIEQASTNLLNIFNAAPTTIQGFTLLSSRPSGATISVVNDLAALQASGLFDEILAAGIMSGQVIRLYNPSADTEFAVPIFGPNGRALSISAFVRVAQGGGYISVTSGGGQTPVFTTGPYRRVGRQHNAGVQARIVLQPMSEIFVTLLQVEQGPITAPIVTAGKAASRGQDALELKGAHLFDHPHVVVIEIDLDRLDNVDRRVLTVANAAGDTVSTSRTSDNSLSLVQSTSLRRPRLPNIVGPGRLRIAQRVTPLGLAIAAAGFRAENAFGVPPTLLSRLVVGSALDGSLPLIGWVRSVEVYREMTDVELAEATAPGEGTMSLNIARYVSPSGNDSNDGLSPSTAWRTLAKIADTTNGISQGTHVFLQRGQEWAETLLPREHCTFAGYGVGARPKVGKGAVHAVDENGANNWWLVGLHLTGATQRGVNSYGGSAICIDDCEVSFCGSATENNGGGVIIRGNTKAATAEMISAPAGATLTNTRTTEAGLSGNFTITCTVAGAGSSSRWQVRRPDGSLIATAIGGTPFNSGGIQFTVTSTSATKVGDQFVVRNKPFSEIPYPSNALANDFMLRGSYVHDIFGLAAGDDVYCEGIGGTIILEGNRLEIPIGRAADCFQVGRATSVYVARPTHVIVRNNFMSMQGKDTDSGKGCCVLLCGSAVVESNEMNGLNFALSLGLEKGGTIRWNKLLDATLNPYSWGIGCGADTDVRDIKIYENIITNCNRAISMSGTGNTTMNADGRTNRLQNRADILMDRNAIVDCLAAFFIDRPTSGTIMFNRIIGTPLAIDRRTQTIPPGRATSLSIGFNTA